MPFERVEKRLKRSPRRDRCRRLRPDRNGLPASVEKQPRLEAGVACFEEQSVASTSKVAATEICEQGEAIEEKSIEEKETEASPS